MNLKDDEPETFNLLIQWMHHGCPAFENLNTLAPPNSVSQRKARGEACHLLCALYCLCDKIQVAKIGDEILGKLRDLIRDGMVLPLAPSTVRMVLENVPESSALHEYVLQKVAGDLLNEWGHDYDHYEEMLEGPEAIEGLVLALFHRMIGKSNNGSRHRGTSHDWKENAVSCTENEHLSWVACGGRTGICGLWFIHGFALFLPTERT